MSQVLKPSHDEWGTPVELYLLLNEEFRFDLDAAATAENNKHTNYISPEQDALVTPWVGRNVWCNPPYSMMAEFVRRGYEQSREHHNTVAMLIPAYTDPRYWWEYCTKAEELRFLKGRLAFLENGHKKTSARFPSVVVVFKWHPGEIRGFPQIRWWDWRVASDD